MADLNCATKSPDILPVVWKCQRRFVVQSEAVQKKKNSAGTRKACVLLICFILTEIQIFIPDIECKVQYPQ